MIPTNGLLDMKFHVSMNVRIANRASKIAIRQA
ncbi:hypothetical protein BPC006_II0683 [Burkholderia pseudomallei BPC006]|nr:hypothetical protein BPC006_II0683 [Burkholderia pseudomallei BPC006]EDS88510.1 hypothetical protein BURPSS13_L0129 [Burkholderia pseudomallei S13]